ETQERVVIDDGWGSGVDDDLPPLRTTVFKDTARTVITRNKSPDVPFDQSINPYRGCEHGCIYCFARPSHSWLGLSPGLEFETKIFAKYDAPSLLRDELHKSGYQCQPIALGVNTDCYQPIERGLGITRGILEVLNDFNHPVSIVTKSAGVLRDLDILSDMASRKLVQIVVSVTTLDGSLARTMEPRAAAPRNRLRTIRALVDAGVPTAVLAAPMIPGLNDPELDDILVAASDAGATQAGYVLLRLPLELKDVFVDWLHSHYPTRADKVLSLMRQSRDGAIYQSEFGKRMSGSGVYADLLRARFRAATKRLGLNARKYQMDCDSFAPPPRAGDQMALF
ncbi:MAG: PA0069 family radical SAM protein, partial [Proteobacteria bacterium]|nr:PA0069 family radical SAM protein [Pseudomonadota bacterium]